MVFPYTRQGAEPRLWAERTLVTCLGEFLTGASHNASMHTAAVLPADKFLFVRSTPLQPFRGGYPC